MRQHPIKKLKDSWMRRVGAASSSFDALNSNAISALVQGDRLALFEEKLLLAQQSFPPSFENRPQEGYVGTPEGNHALELGRWAHERREKAPFNSGSTGQLPKGFPSKEMLERELGGREGLFLVFGLHYCGMFANPRMRVLFDTRHEDTAVSAFDHGKRVASTLLDECHGTSYFASLGRGHSGAFAVMGTHSQAKACPMRPKNHQVSLPAGHPRGNRRFTTAQRDTWVGHIMSACEQLQTSQEFKESFGIWLSTTTSAYAPFVNEDTGESDWMEEMPY